ncbi:MAG: MipA/OmpV family protein [Pseudomonadota bacterium]
MNLRPSLLVIAALVSSALPAMALASDTAPVPSTILGAGVWSRPAYVGSDERVVAAIPSLRYYGTPWFARTTQGMLEGGTRTELFDGLSLGTQLAYEGGRDNKDSDFLKTHHLANLPVSVSYGVHAEWDGKLGPAPVNVLLRYRQELKSYRGAQTDLRGNIGVYGGENLKVGLFAQMTWANDKSNKAYYGVAASQVTSTGLGAFSAEAGIANTAIGMLWSYDLDAHWLLQGSLEQRQLSSKLRLSPLTQTRNNSYGSVGVAYRF